MNKILALIVLSFAATSHAEEMTFSFVGNGGNCHGCEWFVAKGEITPDTPDKFVAFADEFTGAGSLAFESSGGDPEAAMALGRLIRERGWGTDRRGTWLKGDTSHETSLCVSECVLAFLGGVQRDVEENFKLSVTGQGNQWVSEDRLRYVLDMGISPEILLIAAALPEGQVYDFSEAELQEYGLDNARKSTDPWHLEPYKEGLVLTTVQRSGPNYTLPVTLFCRADNPSWHIMVVEPGDFSNFIFANDDLFDFQSEIARQRPWFEFGGTRYELDQGDVDFIKKTQNGLTVSLILPDEITNHSEQDLIFSPNLGRVYGGLLEFTISLPSESWMKIAQRNCI